MVENQIPRAKEGKICHRLGRDVSETCHLCQLFLPTETRWTDANKQQHIEKFYQCADVTMPQAFGALAQQLTAVAAEVEAARKEVGEATEAIRVMKDAEHKQMASAVLSQIAEVGAIAMTARIQEKLIGPR